MLLQLPSVLLTLVVKKLQNKINWQCLRFSGGDHGADWENAVRNAEQKSSWNGT
jgi:hypothetical protein